MKHSLQFLLCIAILGTASAQAQTRESAPVPAHVKRLAEHAAVLRTSPSAIQALRVREAITQSWTGADWENSSRYTYEYEGDNETVSTYETWVDTDWQNNSRTLTEYENGFVSVVTYQVADGGDWVDDTRDVYTYSGDNLVEILSQTNDAGTWVDTDRTIPYNSDNITEGSESQQWDGSEWQPVSTDRFEQEGDDLHYINAEWDESQQAYVDTLRSIYPGLTVEEFYELFSNLEVNADLGFFGASLIFFQIPENTVQEWSGTEWVNVSRQSVTTDGEGRPTEVLYEEWDGTDWQPSFRFLATYDGEGRQETLEMQTFDEEWSTFLLVTNEFDAEGLLARAVYQVNLGAGLQNSFQILYSWTDTGTAAEDVEIPTGIELEPLYPNPFNPTTTVRYSLDAASHARVRVFDVTGRHVRTLVDGMQSAGEHEIVFDAAGLPSGMYLIRLETPKLTVARTVTLLR